tara:strand:- start:916 stop:2367 length:1452 start_codon:yes stop_codon:yes gene_type:complete
MAKVSWKNLKKDHPQGGIYLKVLYQNMIDEEIIKISGAGGPNAVVSAPPGSNVVSDMKDVLDGKKTFEDFQKDYSGAGKLVAIKAGNNGNSTHSIKFTDIERTQAFGSTTGSGMGATKTAKMENAVCWYCAYVWANGKVSSDFLPSQAQFDAVSDKVHGDVPLATIYNWLAEQTEGWVESCCTVANKLRDATEYYNPSYHFYRGKNVGGADIVKTVEDHYYVVNTNEKEGRGSRPFTDINKWSPADIYMCECDFDTTQITNETLFSGLNQKMKELLDAKSLVGVSLKKVGSSCSLRPYNFTRASVRTTKTFNSYRNVSFFGSIDTYIRGGSSRKDPELQLRASDSDGTTFQGEIQGVTAKHGRIGGGNVSDILVASIPGSDGLWKDYNSAQGAVAPSRGTGLDRKLLTLYNKCKDAFLDQTEEVTIDTIAAMPSQWKFSKYFGLVATEAMMDASVDERNEVMKRLYLYGTSQTDDSGPFIKVS